MEENLSMEYNIFSMEWKKIASMECEKIVFHSIPHYALQLTHCSIFLEDFFISTCINSRVVQKKLFFKFNPSPPHLLGW